MDQQQFQQMHKLHEKAKRLEKFGKDGDALEIYLQIHQDYFPNTSDLYDRPIVILEKKKRYEEAIDICKLAIERIEADKVSGSSTSFHKKLEQLTTKLHPDGNEQPKKRKKKIFNPSTWALKDWLILVSIIAIASILLYFFAPNASQFEDIEVNPPIAENSNLALSQEDDEKNPYPITEQMMENAQNMIQSEPDVTGAGIVIEKNRIGFALFIGSDVSKDVAEKHAINFIKALASAASSTYTELSPPNALSFGEIYKHYDCYVSVGQDADNILVKGDKPKNKSTIRWYE